MKLYPCLLGLLFFIITGTHTFSQQPDYHFKLVASKNNREIVLPYGKRYIVHYTDNGKRKKIKAYLTGTNLQTIFLSSKDGKKETEIKLDSVESIQKSNGKLRTILSITGGAGIIGGTVLLNTSDKNPKPDAELLMAIPLIGYSVYALIAILSV